jgi:hypothetical protein
LTYSSTTGSQTIYKDPSGANYIIYTDSNGNKYTKNADNTKNYLTGFSNNTLSTYIVKVDENGQEYAIYSDAFGNRYVLYSDPLTKTKYFLNGDGSKRYPGQQQAVNGIDPSLIQPDTVYRLYTDASGNIYLVYVDSEGRPYTLNPDKTKRYLTEPAAVPTGQIVFQDTYCDKFVLDADGSRNYLKIDPTAQQGANFVTYVNQNGQQYRIFTDPAGNKYTLNLNGTKNYITSFPSQPSTNYKVYTDGLGT